MVPPNLAVNVLPNTTINGPLTIQGFEIIGVKYSIINTYQIQTVSAKGEIKTQEITCYNLPAKNPNFTGRITLLDTLKQHLLKSSTSMMPIALTACHGLGGIGKTEIAKEFVYKHLDDYRTIYWIPADSEESLTRTYLELAKELKLTLDEEKVKEVKEIIRRVKRWLETHPGYLLVFDNALNYEAINAYIPNTGGQVLVTSRYTEWVESILINVFTKEESRIYIQKILAQDSQRKDQPEDMDELAKTLGHLPLALAQASAYIKKTHIGIRDYLGLYEKRKQTLLEDKTLPMGSDHDSVYVTWDITMKSIQSESSFAYELLYLCSYLHHDGIPEFLVKPLANLNELNPKQEIFESALGTLASYSMVAINSETRAIFLHVLIKEVLQLKRSMEKKKQDTQLLGRLLSILYPQDTQEMVTYQTIRQLLPHLEALSQVIASLENPLSHLPRSPETLPIEIQTLLQLWYLLAEGYDGLGFTIKAKDFWERALKIQERHYGKDHVEVASTLGNLATAIGALGDAKTAKELLERALVIKEQHYGKNHVEVARTLGNLATAIGALGDAKTAKELLERALGIKEQHYGKDHVEVASTLGNLATAIGALGDMTGKKRLLERALGIFEQHYGKNHVEVARTLNNLATAIGALGDMKEAKALLERALDIEEQHYGKDHVDVASTLGNLANAIGALGDTKKEKELLERALVIKEQHYGKDHVDVASTLGNLANAIGALGDAKTKKALLERARGIKEQHYGKDHVEVASTLVNLATAIGALGDTKKEKELLERALGIKEQRYGKNHVDVAITLYNLANAIDALGDAKTKKALLERALGIFEQHYGKDHIETANTLGNLACVYLVLKDIAQAATYASKAHHLFSTHFGSAHPDTQAAAKFLEGIKPLLSMEPSSLPLPPESGLSQRQLEKELRNAANQNKVKKLKELLSQVRDVNAQDTGQHQRAALHWAIERQALECVELLLNAGASVTLVDAKGKSPLAMAYEAKHNPLIELLEKALMKKYKLSSLGEADLEKALRNAANRQELHDLRYLISRVKNLNAQDSGEYRRTALHWAIATGFVEGIKLLLEAGADPTLIDGKGKTPLILAQSQKKQEIIELIQHHLSSSSTFNVSAVAEKLAKTQLKSKEDKVSDGLTFFSPAKLSPSRIQSLIAQSTQKISERNGIPIVSIIFSDPKLAGQLQQALKEEGIYNLGMLGNARKINEILPDLNSNANPTDGIDLTEIEYEDVMGKGSFAMLVLSQQQNNNSKEENIEYHLK